MHSDLSGESSSLIKHYLLMMVNVLKLHLFLLQNASALIDNYYDDAEQN